MRWRRRCATGAALTLDLAPGRAEADVAARLARPRGGASLGNHLRKTLGLSPVKIALLREFAPAALTDPEATAAGAQGAAGAARRARGRSTRRSRPRAGCARDALDADLMLRARPGVFAAGEMLDWDAPTGGYLLTACLATGRWAGRGAARWLAR